MARIYLGLAIFSFALLLVNLGLGMATGAYGEAAQEVVAAGAQLKAAKDAGPSKASELAAAQTQFDAALATAQTLQRRVSWHMLVGIASSLVAILVNSISVTYFVGTSRWCKEVVEAYRLDETLILESQRLKRRTFPWALAGMLTIIVLVALGASADPTVNVQTHLTWRAWHFAWAVLGTTFIGYAFWVQVQNVAANYAIIERILAEVQRVRAERGLDAKG